LAERFPLSGPVTTPRRKSRPADGERGARHSEIGISICCECKNKPVLRYGRCLDCVRRLEEFVKSKIESKPPDRARAMIQRFAPEPDKIDKRKGGHYVNPKLSSLIEDFQVLDDHSNMLTEWERGFFDSTWNQYEVTGRLSPKQIRKLSEIADELTRRKRERSR
jgi:hypothetical protein